MNSMRQTATVYIFSHVYLNHICCNHCNIQAVSINPSSCCRTTTLSSSGSASPSGPPTYITIKLKLSLQQQATCLPLYFITNVKPHTIYILRYYYMLTRSTQPAACRQHTHDSLMVPVETWNEKTSSKPSLCKVEKEQWNNFENSWAVYFCSHYDIKNSFCKNVLQIVTP